MKKFLLLLLSISGLSFTSHSQCGTALDAGIIGPDQTICIGSIPSPLNNMISPTGGTGTYSYQWQWNISGTMTNIPGATNINYTSSGPLASSTTTQFQRVVTSGICGSAISNPVTITVTQPETVTVTMTNPGQLCSGAAAVNVTATAITSGTGTLNYEWYLGPNKVGTNSSTYSYTPVSGDAGKTLQVTASTSPGCNPATFGVVLDIVNSLAPAVSISTGTNPNCEGLLNKITAISTNAGNDPIYEWHINSFTGEPGTPTLISSDFANGDEIWLELTSKHSCIIGTNPIISNKIIMTIKPVPAPQINEGDQTICAGKSFTYTSALGSGTTYTWKMDDKVIAGATNSTYTATQAGTYTLTEDNGVCNQTSEPVTLTIDPSCGTSTSVNGPAAKSFAQSGIILFPNPTAESFSIGMPESGIAVSYEILDLTGDSVAQGNFVSTGTAEKITANMGAGMYQIVLRYNDVVTTGRLSKVQ